MLLLRLPFANIIHFINLMEKMRVCLLNRWLRLQVS